MLMLLCLGAYFSNAQTETPPEVRNIYSVMDKIGYPSEAKTAGIEGKVLAEVTVDQRGKVVDHEIQESPSPLLSDAVGKHIGALKFEPARKDGEAIRSKVRVPFLFELPAPIKGGDGLYESVATALKNPMDVIELDLTGTKADKLDPGLSACKNLKILILDDMRLKKLPGFIKGMKSMEEMSITGNQLTSLPGWLANMPNLQSLDVRENKFSDEALEKIRDKYSELDILTD